MKNGSNSVPDITIGLDLGDRYAYMVMLDAQGEIVEEGRVRTTQSGLKNRFGGMPRARIAIEAGTHSPWVSRLLKAADHEVLIANPRMFRLIYKNDSKSDKVDATYLARVARFDQKLLYPISHRGAQAQADLALLRTRDLLVRSRTQLVSHVRGSVKALGSRLPSCSPEAFHKRIPEHIPEPLKPALDPVLKIIQKLTLQIRGYDKQVERMIRDQYQDAQRLRQHHGVGPITSLAYVLTLEDPTRFKTSRTVGAFLGLKPRKKESGDKDPQLRITKAGDTFLRRLLVGCAQYILGPFGQDSDLRRWGLELARRGGKNAKRRAIVAVARRLAVLLHRLWITGKDYEPFYQTGRVRKEPTLA